MGGRPLIPAPRRSQHVTARRSIVIGGATGGNRPRTFPNRPRPPDAPYWRAKA